MTKAYKVTESDSIERRYRTPDGKTATVVERGWYIEYRNPEWKRASVKCVLVTYLEHKLKFIELLQEAGYQEEK